MINMRCLIVDGYLNGTGIRDKYNGGYVDLDDLRLSQSLVSRIKNWLLRYWDEFYNQYDNEEKIRVLDDEGLTIAYCLQKELLEAEVEYFSDAKMMTIKVFH